MLDSALSSSLDELLEEFWRSTILFASIQASIHNAKEEERTSMQCIMWTVYKDSTLEETTR
jgi:hypothetical protein